MSPDLPENPGAERDQAILDKVHQGSFEIVWATITSEFNNHTAEFRVFADAMKIDGIRVPVSANLQQAIADLLNCSLLTAKLADLIFAQRTAGLRPKLEVPDATMVKMSVAANQSEWIDGQLSSAGVTPASGIIQTVGKHWIVDNRLASHPGKACNYGWHLIDGMVVGVNGSLAKSPVNDPAVTLPGVRMIQSRGFAHDGNHTDYSQNVVLVSNVCLVDGQTKLLSDVLESQELAGLATADAKPLKVTRQPGVALQQPIRKPPCIGPACPQPILWTDQTASSGSRLIAGALALTAVVAGFIGSLMLFDKPAAR